MTTIHRAVTYRRASTREQSDSGLGLEAQTAALEAILTAKGWEHVADRHDVSTGKKRNGRPGLDEILGMLERGEADVLVVAKLDRLARSVVDFGHIVRQSIEQGWALKVLDPDVDTSTASGRLCANVLVAVAEWEGDIIAERTVTALAQAKKRGTRLGRPVEMDPKVRRRIVRMRDRGMSLAAIADKLNDDRTPTARAGSRWHPTTIARVVQSV